MYNLNAICEILHDHDYKVTPQRQVILEVFLEQPGRHLSAEDVLSFIKEAHPEIGVATVYRTLDLLAELGILQKLNLDDGKSRYEFCDKAVHHHHHLICLQCGEVTEFEDDLLESLEAMIARKAGFEVMDHQLKIYGYCRKCRQR